MPSKGCLFYSELPENDSSCKRVYIDVDLDRIEEACQAGMVGIYMNRKNGFSIKDMHGLTAPKKSKIRGGLLTMGGWGDIQNYFSSRKWDVIACNFETVGFLACFLLGSIKEAQAKGSLTLTDLRSTAKELQPLLSDIKKSPMNGKFPTKVPSLGRLGTTVLYIDTDKVKIDEALGLGYDAILIKHTDKDADFDFDKVEVYDTKNSSGNDAGSDV